VVFPIIVINVTNQRKMTEQDDGLIVKENEDGTFTLEWDEKDPRWSMLNGLTQEEVTAILIEGFEKLEKELKND
jgi:hypothetical protein